RPLRARGDRGRGRGGGPGPGGGVDHGGAEVTSRGGREGKRLEKRTSWDVLDAVRAPALPAQFRTARLGRQGGSLASHPGGPAPGRAAARPAPATSCGSP